MTNRSFRGVLPRCAPKSVSARKYGRKVVALTGIEPAGRQFSSVQLGLSSCVFGLVQFATRAFRAVRVADVLRRCCPAARDSVTQMPDPLRAGRFGEETP